MEGSPNSELGYDAGRRDALRNAVRGTLTRLSATGGLPVLPAVATAALGIVQDPDGDVADLTQVIQTDVGLTARVLRVANSAGFGRRRPATTLRDAVITIGLRQTCDVLVAVCAKQLYTAPGPHTDVLWNHSLAVAVAAEELARVLGRVPPSDCFLPGLFHDLGRLAFQQADPAAFAELLHAVERGEGDASALERERFGFEHAQAGSIVSEDWNLRQEQCDAILWHHEPERAQTGRELATIINGADYLAYVAGYGTAGRPPAGIGITALGFSLEDEATIVDRVRAEFTKRRELIG